MKFELESLVRAVEEMHRLIKKKLCIKLFWGNIIEQLCSKIIESAKSHDLWIIALNFERMCTDY